MTGARVVLASGSPRRRVLLRYLVDDFLVEAPEVDESVPEPLAVRDAVLQVARRKAQAVAQAVGPAMPDAVVLAADTALELDGVRLGKPVDEAHLRILLHALGGRPHTVWTGVAVANGGAVAGEAAVASTVTFSPLPPELLDAYARSSAWHGKAGGYGIQDPYLQDHLRLDGPWSNVVGLPLGETARLLADAGVPCHEPPSEAALARDNPF